MGNHHQHGRRENAAGKIRVVPELGKPGSGCDGKPKRHYLSPICGACCSCGFPWGCFTNLRTDRPCWCSLPDHQVFLDTAAPCLNIGTRSRRLLPTCRGGMPADEYLAARMGLHRHGMADASLLAGPGRDRAGRFFVPCIMRTNPSLAEKHRAGGLATSWGPVQSAD